MSRVGKSPITVPAGVTCSFNNKDLHVKGKLGEQRYTIPEHVSHVFEDQIIKLTPIDQSTRARTLWGTAQRTIANMVHGVHEGFSVTLNLVGVGYRANVVGSKITLQLGFSHDVVYDLPQGVVAKCDKPTELVLTGPNKQQVGQIAAEIRKNRKPEPYKGKGVIRQGEYVVRKEGKKK